MRHYEVLQVVLRDTTGYYELYHEVLQVVLPVTMRYYENLAKRYWSELLILRWMFAAYIEVSGVI